jgi:hypothetical protein
LAENSERAGLPLAPSAGRDSDSRSSRSFADVEGADGAHLLTDVCAEELCDVGKGRRRTPRQSRIVHPLIECHGELEVITVVDSSTPASSTALLSHERHDEVQTGERPSLWLIELSKLPTPLH